MPSYTITLTDNEDKALRHVAVDPQEWIENAIRARCRKAAAEIVESETQRMMNDPGISTIPADPDLIVTQSNLPDAAARHAATLAAIESDPV